MGHRDWIVALRRSHEHLLDVVSDPGAKPTNPSYCTEWTIAQVLSHLGSGAEIGLLNLNAALAGDPPPERERYFAIWDVWNAKTPEEMAKDAIVSDEAHIARLEGLSDEELDGVRVPMMGRELDASGVVAMRLYEHAVHTWDIEVMTDPGAAVQAGAVELLIDRLPDRIGRQARGEKPAPAALGVDTTTPARSLGLTIGTDEVSGERQDHLDGTVTLPAEAFLRLVAGRLDPEHTPSGVTVAGPVSLDALRALFAGS